MIEPNPDYVTAPYVCSGWIGGMLAFCSASPPVLDEDSPDNFWIKLPERQPMHFKNGKWVPWLNPPPGWESFLPPDPRFSDC